MDFKLADLKTRYTKLVSDKTLVFADAKLKPIYQRSLPERSEFIFEGVDAAALAEYGEVLTPSLEDLFVATNSSSASISNAGV